MITNHLDLGYDACPLNSDNRNVVHAVGFATPKSMEPRFFRQANASLEPIHIRIPHLTPSSTSLGL